MYGQTHVPEFRQYHVYQIRGLLLTKFGDMGLAVHGTSTQTRFTVHAVYCTSCVRAVYEVCTRCLARTHFNGATANALYSYCT